MSYVDLNETFVRTDSVVADIDMKQRLIDLLAVPWDQETEVPWRGEMWREVFRRGAFDGLADHAGRVLVTRDHTDVQRGPTVGKLVFVDPKNNDGLFVRAKVAQTQLGDETLALAEEDLVGPSVSYRIKKPEDIRLEHRTRGREILRAFLDHVSLVGFPAYAGAQVLAVREDQRGLTVEPPPEAQSLDEAWSHPAYVRALERLTEHDH